MVTWDVVLHADCAQPVVVVVGRVVEADGAAHLCRDYVAWHGPADRRDPWTVDVADGWRPVVKVQARAA